MFIDILSSLFPLHAHPVQLPAAAAVLGSCSGLCMCSRYPRESTRSVVGRITLYKKYTHLDINIRVANPKWKLGQDSKTPIPVSDMLLISWGETYRSKQYAHQKNRFRSSTVYGSISLDSRVFEIERWNLSLIHSRSAKPTRCLVHDKLGEIREKADDEPDWGFSLHG